jgi:hypothetical protein
VKKVYRPGDDIQRVRQKVCQDILISKLTDDVLLGAMIRFVEKPQKDSIKKSRRFPRGSSIML